MCDLELCSYDLSKAGFGQGHMVCGQAVGS